MNGKGLPRGVWPHFAGRLASLLASLALAASGPMSPAALAAQPAPAPATEHFIYLPVVFGPAGCQAVSSNAYQAGPVFQRETDNPVRPAGNHADKNLALRGYAGNPGALKAFIDYGPSIDPTSPPQLATLFSPNRVPPFTGAYQVYTWNWAPSPDPGARGGLATNWAMSVAGLGATPGEALHTPSSGYDIGAGMEAIVVFADADSLTLVYTRDDTAAGGYALHLDNICTDPNLLALYQSLDGGARYVYHGPPDGGADYNLPTLAAGQVFGTARGPELRVAIVDSGSFMDPRSCNDWWQVRPGHSCP